jgi:hypothetical protein
LRLATHKTRTSNSPASTLDRKSSQYLWLILVRPCTTSTPRQRSRHAISKLCGSGRWSLSNSPAKCPFTSGSTALTLSHLDVEPTTFTCGGATCEMSLGREIRHSVAVLALGDCLWLWWFS